MLASSWQGQTLLLTNVSEAPQSFPPCHHTVHEPFGRTCGADASPTESETITDITHLIKRAQKKQQDAPSISTASKGHAMSCPLQSIAWGLPILTCLYHALSMNIMEYLSEPIWAMGLSAFIAWDLPNQCDPTRHQRHQAATSKSWKAVSQCPAPIAAP